MRKRTFEGVAVDNRRLDAAQPRSPLGVEFHRPGVQFLVGDHVQDEIAAGQQLDLGPGLARHGADERGAVLFAAGQQQLVVVKRPLRRQCGSSGQHSRPQRRRQQGSRPGVGGRQGTGVLLGHVVEVSGRTLFLLQPDHARRRHDGDSAGVADVVLGPQGEGERFGQVVDLAFVDVVGLFLQRHVTAFVLAPVLERNLIGNDQFAQAAAQAAVGDVAVHLLQKGLWFLKRLVEASQAGPHAQEGSLREVATAGEEQLEQPLPLLFQECVFLRLERIYGELDLVEREANVRVARPPVGRGQQVIVVGDVAEAQVAQVAQGGGAQRSYGTLRSCMAYSMARTRIGTEEVPLPTLSSPLAGKLIVWSRVRLGQGSLSSRTLARTRCRPPG